MTITTATTGENVIAESKASDRNRASSLSRVSDRSAEDLVSQWDTWQKAGGPSAGFDLIQWSLDALSTLRKISQPG